MKTNATSATFMQRRGLRGVLHLLVLFLSLLLVIFISVDTFKGIPFYTQTVYMHVQLCVCILFLIDFLIEWRLATDKRRYLSTHFIFLLVSIPYLNIIQYLGLTFSSEATYLLRFIPLIRGGYALAIVVEWMTYNRISGLLFTYISMLLAMIYFSSLAFYLAEMGANPLVKQYGDALWWAFMDATTVGSNIIATTVTGQILSVLLAALGMMMFPIFTVYVTNLVERRNQARKAHFNLKND
ncbi:MAG: two pore domain potassium channel family protein [Bacteroides sp.]|nr:two pore domain potassium channel family protein [Bacteroides sp.]